MQIPYYIYLLFYGFVAFLEASFESPPRDEMVVAWTFQHSIEWLQEWAANTGVYLLEITVTAAPVSIQKSVSQFSQFSQRRIVQGLLSFDTVPKNAPCPR